MMIYVDYLSQMYDKLVWTHITLDNTLSVLDHTRRLSTYKQATFNALLARGKYSMKESRRKHDVTTADVALVFHVIKRTKLLEDNTPMHRCISPVHTQLMHMGTHTQQWKLDIDDNIHYCEETQLCDWLSIN